ncbi:hypothetical protein BURKHO8Y_240257 [Burkholderia sp. 8Y]|nr:hypothetical protein BURKHO8Y_240257 [Burkholderia sp. 8Y]
MQQNVALGGFRSRFAAAYRLSTDDSPKSAAVLLALARVFARGRAREAPTSAGLPSALNNCLVKPAERTKQNYKFPYKSDS